MDVVVLVALAPIATELVGIGCAWAAARDGALVTELPSGRRRLHLLATYVRPITELTFLLGLVYLCGGALGAAL